MRDPILITGCARSGTSMTSGIIERCGASGGDMFGPNKYNPRGMYENRIVREGVMKPFLRSINADPLGQNPLPNIHAVWEKAKDEKFVAAWRKTIQCIFQTQGIDDETPWFYKGAKLCLVWPLWAAAFPNAKWVLVRRNEPGIINSCLKTRFMRAFRTVEGWQGWINIHNERFREMKSSPDLQIKEVWPDKLFAGISQGGYPELVQWLDLTWNEEVFTGFVDPVLWKKG